MAHVWPAETAFERVDLFWRAKGAVSARPSWPCGVIASGGSSRSRGRAFWSCGWATVPSPTAGDIAVGQFSLGLDSRRAAVADDRLGRAGVDRPSVLCPALERSADLRRSCGTVAGSTCRRTRSLRTMCGVTRRWSPCAGRYDKESLRKVYARRKSLVLSIDGIQPRRGMRRCMWSAS